MSLAMPNPNPVVTWLLCTNQTEFLLWRAIDSCLCQTFSDFELLIITNGPEAETMERQVKERYKSDDRVHVIASDIRMLNFNLSLGVLKARGKYIARMDADDVSLPERLASQVAFLDTHPEVIVLGSSYELVDGCGILYGKVNRPCTDSEIRKMLFYSNPFCHPSVMLRRNAIANAGAYLGGRNAEDYDLWCRLSLQYPEGSIFANLSEPLLHYNINPSGPARRSREAYSNVVACQVHAFLMTGHWRWLIGSILTVGKLMFRSRRR
jgi:glycosyltransferase involved in cell wall biosynthesis